MGMPYFLPLHRRLRRKLHRGAAATDSAIAARHPHASHLPEGSFLIRKLAHMTEYAIFAMLIYGSGREDDPFRWVPQRDVLQKPCREEHCYA